MADASMDPAGAARPAGGCVMKFINPRVHGIIDYLVVLAFLLAPTMFNFSHTPTVLCYSIAAVHGLMTLLTAFPMGVIDLIPFKVHGGIELAVSIGLAAVPWLFGFVTEEAPRNFFLVSGLAVFCVWMLTAYVSEGHVAGSGKVHAPHLTAWQA
jgi:hypothetical protein